MGIGLLTSGVAGAESPRVAMLPVVVHSAEAETAYLSTGLADMLTARLERNPGLEVVRVESDSRATTRREVAIEAARKAGADYVVYGAFTQFGSGASLDVSCAPVNEVAGFESEPRQVFIQSGAVGEIIPKLDDLAAKIARFVLGGGGGSEPASPAESGAPGLGARASVGSVEFEDLRQRVEALERAIDPARALEELEQLAPADGTIGLSDEGPASAAPGSIPLR